MDLNWTLYCIAVLACLALATSKPTGDFFPDDESQGTSSVNRSSISRHRRGVLEKALERILEESNPGSAEDFTSEERRAIRHMLRNHRHQSERHRMSLTSPGDVNENGWGGGYGK